MSPTACPISSLCKDFELLFILSKKGWTPHTERSIKRLLRATKINVPLQNIYAAKIGASTVVGKFTFDNKGYLASVDDSMLAILAEKNLDFIGKKSMADYLPEEELNAHLGRFMIFVTVGALHDQPMTIISMDGVRKHIIFTANTVYNKHGDFDHGEATIRVKERDQITLAWEGRQRARIMTNDLVGVVA